MELFHHKKECEDCHEKFQSYALLVEHMKKVHNLHPIKCHDCGMEFIHEKDRLHHVREEKEKEYDQRIHKDEYQPNGHTPQENVNDRMHKFGDNF